MTSLLIGKEYCKIDANGRFKLPSNMKKLLSSVIDDGFIIKESIFDNCLELWPRKEFEVKLKADASQLNNYNPSDRLLIRKLSEGNPVELDCNDRILIPADQKKSKKINKDIVLISKVNNCIEVWDMDAYNNLEATPIDWAKLFSERLGKTSESKPENL